MKTRCEQLVLATAVVIAVMLAGAPDSVRATGTAQIKQRDGAIKTYYNVRIDIRNESMAITSNDGKGTLVFGKAACTKVGELVRCIPYDATLLQYGQKTHVPLESGTVWLNPSQAIQKLSYSSTQLPPRGVVLAIQTKRGTYVTLTGVVDSLQK